MALPVEDSPPPRLGLLGRVFIVLAVTFVTYLLASGIAASIAMDRDAEDLGGLIEAYVLIGPVIALLAGGLTIALVSAWRRRLIAPAARK